MIECTLISCTDRGACSTSFEYKVLAMQAAINKAAINKLVVQLRVRDLLGCNIGRFDLSNHSASFRHQ